MPNRSFYLALVLVGFVAVACTLPGASSPTPFTFPTPNLTHTAIFAATPSETPLPPTLPAVEYTDTPALPSPTPGGPTDTPAAFTPTAGSVAPGLRPNGSPVTAAFLASPPTIDGDLQDWTSTGYTIDQALPYAKSGWTGPADLSATYYLGWDTSYLYIGVQRVDDTFVQISYGRYMYRGDDVELQLDTDLNGDFNSTILSADDYQVGLSPGNFGSRDEEAYRWYPRSLESWLNAAKVAAIRDGEGYKLEARIPWTAFGITPASGANYGFAISLSDNDVAGTSSWQSMVSSVQTRKLANPTTWGTLTLGQSD
jgi:hypothetical protein